MHQKPLRRIQTVITLFAAALLAGCADFSLRPEVEVTTYRASENWLDAPFYSIRHPFSDDGKRRAQARAGALCGEKRLLAIEGKRACTLQDCVTEFVCVKPEDAAASGLVGAGQSAPAAAPTPARP